MLKTACYTPFSRFLAFDFAAHHGGLSVPAAMTPSRIALDTALTEFQEEKNFFQLLTALP